MNPLLNYNGSGTPYPNTVSPLLADVSGATACEQPISTDDCRYVPVPATHGSLTPASAELSGPACATCDQSPDTFTQTDATTTTQTLGNQTSSSQGWSYTVGISVFGFPLSWSTSDTLTWTELESTGAINGTTNALTVSLNSSTVDCVEDISIYEDTVFQYPFGEPHSSV